MSIELTEEQRQALAREPEPCCLVDPQTKRSCILLSAERYEELLSLLDDSLDMRQVGALVEANMREYDADDPLLEGYQE